MRPVHRQTLRRWLGRIAVACLLLLMAGPGSTAVGGQSEITATARGNAAQTGEFPGPGPNGEPAVRWRFDTTGTCPSGGCGGYVDPPTVAGDVAYVASAAGLAAIDPASGRRIWQAAASGAYSDATVTGGLVVAGTSDFMSGRAIIVAFDAASGSLVWQRAVAGRPVGLTVGEGLVFAGTANPAGSSVGILYAIDAATGDEVWRIEAQGQFNRPAYVSGRVIVGNSDTVRAINAADGAALWTTTLDGFVLSPAATEELAYIGGDAVLYAIDVTTGEVIWTFDTGAYNARAAVAAGRVFVTGSGVDALFALEAATGQPLWSFPTDDELGVPSVADGVVYAGSGNGTLYAVDAASGHARWDLSVMRGLATTSPVIAGGLVYLGSGSGGELIAIGDLSPFYVPEDSDPFPDADS